MHNAVSTDREILVIRANETVRNSWLETLKPLADSGYKSRGIATRKELLEDTDLYKVGLIVANEDFTSKTGISELPEALKKKGHGDIPVILIVAPQTNERFNKKDFAALYKDLEGFLKVTLIKEPFQREEVVRAASELLMGVDYKTRQLRDWAKEKGLSITFKNGIATITRKLPEQPLATATESQPSAAPEPPHP
ncbi:MAG TPA: hypothetical protein DEA55_11055 [Rhodospirillaceae bacterium]|nr:hypothetical protein [Rhodospirillaceae bacterium]